MFTIGAKWLLHHLLLSYTFYTEHYGADNYWHMRIYDHPSNRTINYLHMTPSKEKYCEREILLKRNIAKEKYYIREILQMI